MSEKRRVSYLTMTEFRALDDWARLVSEMFGGYPYLVGSAVTSPDYQDVDLRLPLADDKYEVLNRLVSVKRLNHIVSLWGQRATGLPIDFQVHTQTEYESNAKKTDVRPNPMGLREDQMTLHTTVGGEE